VCAGKEVGGIVEKAKIKQSDGLEIEAIFRSYFQSLGPSFDAPVLTSPSGW
jgi:hypothetical protein